MRNLKHTPGAWEIIRETEDVDDRTYIKSKPWWIAEIFNVTPGGVNDATLIAAAPEMLETLIGVLAEFEHTPELSGNCTIYNKCCDAIEKATGMKIEEVLK